MLAQSFLSAADLGIEEVARDALIKVLHMMERGELVHYPYSCRKPIPNGFAMWEWDCETGACIGGWAERISGRPLFRRHGPTNLKKLFFPSTSGDLDAYNAAPEQAARALSNYLTTGEPDWESALAT